MKVKRTNGAPPTDLVNLNFDLTQVFADEFNFDLGASIVGTYNGKVKVISQGQKTIVVYPGLKADWVNEDDPSKAISIIASGPVTYTDEGFVNTAHGSVYYLDDSGNPVFIETIGRWEFTDTVEGHGRSVDLLDVLI